MIKQETIQAILDTVNIEEVVGDFVSLKKRGANLIGLCPFHNEKTPSFIVSPAKGIYKCFGCGKAGNAVQFIMDHEHYSYPDALKYLAAKYKIPVIETERTPEEIELDNEKDRLFNINTFAQKYFTDNLLNTQEGQAIGLSYFRKRGFNDATINTFQLGYSIDSFNALIDYCHKNGYKDDILAKSGLAVVHDDGKMFDRFRGRVMFPIHNLTGRVIGFGGRILTSDKNTAKYLNSPESDIYHKSDTLYGIYLAKNSIVSKNFCYLVEGYMDMITMYQAGFTNVVASSGTSLTTNQIRLIKRFTNNVTIIYDGDAAGIKASLRGIDMVLSEGLNVKIILLPEPEDPDSFIKNNRTSDVIDYFENKPRDFIRFKTELLLNDAKDDPIKKAEVIKDIIASIAVIPDEIYRAMYIKECSDLLGVKEQTIIFEVNKIIRKKLGKKFNDPDIPVHEDPIQQPLTQEEQNAEKINSFDIYERAVIEKLFLYGDIQSNYSQGTENEAQTLSNAEFIINELEAEGIEFNNQLYSRILNIYRENLHNGIIPGQRYFINNADREISTLAANLISTPYSLSEKWKENHIFPRMESDDIPDTIIKTLLSFKSAFIKRLRAEIQEKLKNAEDGKEMEDLLETDKQYKQVEINIDSLLNRTISY